MYPKSNPPTEFPTILDSDPMTVQRDTPETAEHCALCDYPLCPKPDCAISIEWALINAIPI